jgi:hypothetical protein
MFSSSTWLIKDIDEWQDFNPYFKARIFYTDEFSHKRWSIRSHILKGKGMAVMSIGKNLEAKVCNLDFKKRRIPKYKVQTKPYFLKSCHIGKCGIEQSSETNWRLK